MGAAQKQTPLHVWLVLDIHIKMWWFLFSFNNVTLKSIWGYLLWLFAKKKNAEEGRKRQPQPTIQHGEPVKTANGNWKIQPRPARVKQMSDHRGSATLAVLWPVQDELSTYVGVCYPVMLSEISLTPAALSGCLQELGKFTPRQPQNNSLLYVCQTHSLVLVLKT